MSRVESPAQSTIPAPTSPVPERGKLPAWQLQFALLGLMWGLSFLFIKVADEQLAPIQVALGRMVFGTLVLGLILLARRERLPRGARVWAHLPVVAVIVNAIPFTLFAYAEQRIPSALAGIGNATTPLFTGLLAFLVLPTERLTARRTGGLVLGFLGVLVVLGVWNGFGAVDPIGVGMTLAAAGCYGIGWVYVRRFLSDTGFSSISLSTAQLLVGTVELAVVTPFVSPMPTALPIRVLGSVALLGILGTGLAYLLQYNLIRAAGATLASSVTYLVPVVSIFVGIVVLHERLTWYALLGAAIVIAGAAVCQSGGGAGTSRRGVQRRPA